MNGPLCADQAGSRCSQRCGWKAATGIGWSACAGIRGARRSRRTDAIVAAFLEPSGCESHPPHRTARDYTEVYGAHDRIFDCRGLGWSNLQSFRLNVPLFADDEFGRLHIAAPAMLPALSASSPFCEGKLTGWIDSQLASRAS